MPLLYVCALCHSNARKCTSLPKLARGRFFFVKKSFIFYTNVFSFEEKRVVEKEKDRREGEIERD